MVNVKCFPLAGVQNYGIEDFQNYLGNRAAGLYSADDNLRVSATAPASMAVTVSAGFAWLYAGTMRGVVFPMRESQTLAIAAADGLDSRIDTIVVGLDKTNRTGYIKVVTGLIGGGATAPVRDSNYYELILAHISVPAGSVEITSGLITDKRADESICGFMRDGAAIINTLVSSSVTSVLSAAMGKQLHDEKAPKASPTFTGTATIPTANTTTENATTANIGTANVSGFTQLGTAAPKIKVKKFTGLMPAVGGTATIFAHGIPAEKIISVSALVANDSTGKNWVMPNHAPSWEYWLSISNGVVNGTDYEEISVVTSLNNSNSVLGRAFKIVVTYEE